MCLGVLCRWRWETWTLSTSVICRLWWSTQWPSLPCTRRANQSRSPMDSPPVRHCSFCWSVGIHESVRRLASVQTLNSNPGQMRSNVPEEIAYLDCVLHLCYFNPPSPSLLKKNFSQFLEMNQTNSIIRQSTPLRKPSRTEFYYPFWSLCCFGFLPISFAPWHNSLATLKRSSHSPFLFCHANRYWFVGLSL